MQIPPLYKKQNWQYFIIGLILGGFLGYGVFLYMYGELTERWIEENLSLQSQVRDLEKKLEVESENKEELSKKSQQKITVQEIEIELLNAEELRLDRLSVRLLTDAVKDEASDVLGKEIQSVSNNRTLLKRSIENKTYKIDSFAYGVKIEHLTISQTVYLSLKITIRSR
ncbi:hypothetical protein RZN22_05055 [Bacillaceae bacterium S4-13-58]